MINMSTIPSFYIIIVCINDNLKLIKIKKKLKKNKMDIIYTRIHKLKFTVHCSTVMNNVLYVVISEGDIHIIRLIRINLDDMKEIDSDNIDYKYKNNTVFKIIKDKLYCYRVVKDRYNDYKCERDEYIEDGVNNLSVFDINSMDRKQYTIDGLKDVVELGGQIYYINGKNRVYDVCILNENENVYYANDKRGIYDLNISNDDENVYFTIDTRLGGTHIDNDVLSLGIDFRPDFVIGFRYYGDNLISLSSKNMILYANMKTKEIGYSQCLKENKKYTFIGNNKLFGNNIIYDYIIGETVVSGLNIKNSFKYNDDDYYISVDEKDNIFIIDTCTKS